MSTKPFSYVTSKKVALATAKKGTNSYVKLVENGVAMQNFSIPPGHILTPHWHPNSNETTYCLGGSGMVGLVIPDPNKKQPLKADYKVYGFSKGQVVFLPQGYAHYFANPATAKENLVIRLTFENPNPDIMTFAEVNAVLPKNITNAATSFKGNPASSPVIPYKSKKK